MFPLGTVLMPGAPLQLQVFEPRYQTLLADCLAGDGRFGVVLIERGSEVGGDDQRTDAGTLAQIIGTGDLGEGRTALLAVGTHRIQIVRWLHDDPYPRAEVVDWPDEPVADATRLTGLYTRCSAKLRELFGELLRETQRITSEGDFEAAKEIVETYGVKVDQDIHKEVLDRNAKFDTAPYSGFVNPEIKPIKNEDGEITGFELLQPKDFAEQMLYYSENYSNLPLVN